MVMEIGDKVTATNGPITMVIRAWTEPGDERALRIRMTFGDDPSAERKTVVAADTDQVVETIRTWLASLT
ncbi:MAG: hypothetical protein ABIW36_06135 [Terrimesophilobacter sp.]